jgi:hypothetical protein
MDELRAYLEAPEKSGFTVAGVINWLSSTAFGRDTGVLGLAALYRWLTRPLSRPAPNQRRMSNYDPVLYARARDSSLPALLALTPKQLANLAQVGKWCSERRGGPSAAEFKLSRAAQTSWAGCSAR